MFTPVALESPVTSPPTHPLVASRLAGHLGGDARSPHSVHVPPAADEHGVDFGFLGFGYFGFDRIEVEAGCYANLQSAVAPGNSITEPDAPNLGPLIFDVGIYGFLRRKKRFELGNGVVNTLVCPETGVSVTCASLKGWLRSPLVFSTKFVSSAGQERIN